MRTLSGPAVCLLILTSPANAAGELFRCTALDAVSLDQDGGLSRDEIAVSKEKLWTNVIIDTSSGVIRHGTWVRTWHVVQERSDVNDFVASPSPTIRAGFTEFLRVRKWKAQPNVSFLVFELSWIVAGRCDEIE